MANRSLLKVLKRKTRIQSPPKKYIVNIFPILDKYVFPIVIKNIYMQILRMTESYLSLRQSKEKSDKTNPDKNKTPRGKNKN